MHYTELEVLDKMNNCYHSDKTVILNYLTQLPDWRSRVFPRHKKYIISLVIGLSYQEISHKFGYSIEGIENIFRKIQTCLKMELDWDKENTKIKEEVKKERIKTDKDELLIYIFNYLKSISDINVNGILNPIRKNIVKLVLKNKTIEEMENSLGIDANSIYYMLFTNENDSIFIDIKHL